MIIPPFMGVCSGGQEGRALDFYTWYKYSIDRSLIVLFFGLFPLPPPMGYFVRNEWLEQGRRQKNFQGGGAMKKRPQKEHY